VTLTWLTLTMSQDSLPPSKLRDTALRILAQREHSATELKRKLANKGFALADIETLVKELENQHWLDEARFAEMLVRSRVAQGYGPLHIRQDLRQRGVAENTQSLALETYADQWQECARQARCKRFGNSPPHTLKERAKQARFLTYRGFTSEQIRAAFAVSAFE